MFKKLNQKGFSHHLIIPVLAILAVAGIGTYMVTKSKAFSYMSGVTPYSCTQDPTPTLQLNSSGECVKALQYRLNQWITNTKQPIRQLKITGKFDRKTQETVKAFQKSVGLTADGIVGETTWQKLSDWSCIVSVNCGL